MTKGYYDDLIIWCDSKCGGMCRVLKYDSAMECTDSHRTVYGSDYTCVGCPYHSRPFKILSDQRVYDGRY